MAKKSFKLDFNVLLIIAFVLIGIVLYCSTFKEGLTKRERKEKKKRERKEKKKKERRKKYKEKKKKRKIEFIGGHFKLNSFRGGQELLDENGNCIYSDKGVPVDKTYTGITLCDNIGKTNTNNPGRYNYKAKNINDKCPWNFPYQNKCHPDKDYRNTCVKKKIRNQFCDATDNPYRGGQELLDKNGKCKFSDKSVPVDETYTGITLCDNINPNTNNPGRYTYKAKKYDGGGCPTAFPYQNKCHPDKDYRNTCVKKKIRNQFCDATNGKLISIDTDYLSVPYTFVTTADPNSEGKCPHGYRSFRNREKNSDGTNDEGQTVFNFLTGRHYIRYKREDETKKKDYWFYKQGDKDEKGQLITSDTLENKILNDHPELFDSCIKNKDFNRVCRSIKTKPKKVVEVLYDENDNEIGTMHNIDQNPEWYDKYVPGNNKNCVTKVQSRYAGAVTGNVAGAIATAFLA